MLHLKGFGRLPFVSLFLMTASIFVSLIAASLSPATSSLKVRFYPPEQLGYLCSYPEEYISSPEDWQHVYYHCYQCGDQLCASTNVCPDGSIYRSGDHCDPDPTARLHRRDVNTAPVCKVVGLAPNLTDRHGFYSCYRCKDKSGLCAQPFKCFGTQEFNLERLKCEPTSPHESALLTKALYIRSTTNIGGALPAGHPPALPPNSECPTDMVVSQSPDQDLGLQLCGQPGTYKVASPFDAHSWIQCYPCGQDLAKQCASVHLCNVTCKYNASREQCTLIKKFTDLQQPSTLKPRDGEQACPESDIHPPPEVSPEVLGSQVCSFDGDYRVASPFDWQHSYIHCYPCPEDGSKRCGDTFYCSSACLYNGAAGFCVLNPNAKLVR